jgi:hypothetical protein
MSEDQRRLRRALDTIRDIANAASADDGETNDERVQNKSWNQAPIADFGCTIKTLPTRLLVTAAETARRINPVNRPGGPVLLPADSSVMEPLRIAVLTTKYWGPTPRRLTVSFMETTPANLRAHIIDHMNAWSQTACISFAETTAVGQVRISRGPGGYYSYLGTDILHIPSNVQTMNLQDFTMNTPESEYKRVVRHETGHTLGAPHEHMRQALVARIDPQKAYAYFLQTQGWDKATVDAQVLTPLSEASLMSTPVDQDSIMCYQLPGSITRDGLPIRGGTDINATDFAFMGKIYPKRSASPNPAQAAPTVAEDAWPESEDVEVDIPALTR